MSFCNTGITIGVQRLTWVSPRLLQGVRRPPLPDRLGVKRALAVHESGKGVVATLLRSRTGFLERIERVSMVPRGGCEQS